MVSLFKAMTASHTFPAWLTGLWLLALASVALAPRSCTVPAPHFLQEPVKPRAVATRPAYLVYPLPRPAKVKRDSLGHVIHLKK